MTSLKHASIQTRVDSSIDAMNSMSIEQLTKSRDKDMALISHEKLVELATHVRDCWLVLEQAIILLALYHKTYSLNKTHIDYLDETEYLLVSMKHSPIFKQTNQLLKSIQKERTQQAAFFFNKVHKCMQTNSDHHLVIPATIDCTLNLMTAYFYLAHSYTTKCDTHYQTMKRYIVKHTQIQSQLMIEMDNISKILCYQLNQLHITPAHSQILLGSYNKLKKHSENMTKRHLTSPFKKKVDFLLSQIHSKLKKANRK